MIQLGSVDAVIAAIEEDAAAEVEETDRGCRDAVARLERDAALRPLALDDAEARLADARRRVRDRLAAEDRADHEMALNEREEWLARVASEGARRLAALPREAALEDVRTFAIEALTYMPDEPLELVVPPWAIDTLANAVRDGILARDRRDVAVRADPALASGCVAQTRDGRIRYDNSYEARIKRFGPLLRARSANLYAGCLHVVGEVA